MVKFTPKRLGDAVFLFTVMVAGANHPDYLIYPIRTLDIAQCATLAEHISWHAGQASPGGRIYVATRPWKDTRQYWIAPLLDEGYKALKRNTMVCTS